MSTPFVLKLEYGARLSDQDRQVLEQSVRDVQQFKPRHDLILKDNTPKTVPVILEGFACRYKLLPDGTRQIMAYLVPGDCCDLHVPILSRIDHTVGTLTACKVALLPHTMIEDMTTQSRGITRALCGQPSPIRGSCGSGSSTWVVDLPTSGWRISCASCWCAFRRSGWPLTTASCCR